MSDEIIKDSGLPENIQAQPQESEAFDEPEKVTKAFARPVDKSAGKNMEKSIAVAKEAKEIPSGFKHRSGEPEWCIVHTYSGHEDKVKKNLEKLVESRGMQDLVLQVVVPKETIVERRETGSRTRERKVFPGYVLVKMIVTNESWYLVRNTQGVTGFVGQGSDPLPLSDEEIRRLGIDDVKYELNINVGDRVKIISGPLKNHTGIVEEINKDKQTLKTKVDMFGRATPAELEYAQVDKLS